jgi:hypothetical protein
MMNKIINYNLIDNEKIKASYSQSKSTGKLFFDVSVSAKDKDELGKISRDVINTAVTICNEFNKEQDKKNKKKPTEIKEPSKGLK